MYDTPAGAEILLQGNQAIARGAVEGGLAYAAGYPGNPSSEILETLAEARTPGRLYVEWSVNEKVALEGAAAASLSGLRAMVTMKQNGLNVCMDSLTTLALSGIRSGLVIAVADDPSAISSSNEQDARFAAYSAHIPLIEPATPQEALEWTRFAFELSEKIGNIVLLRSLSRLSHTRANVRVGEVPPKAPRPVFDTSTSYHCFPVVPKHRVMYDKLARAGEMIAARGLNRYEGPDDAKLVVVASGPSRLYAREALEMTGLAGETGLIEIGAGWPLPEALIVKHFKHADEILFVEEIDPLLEGHVKAVAAQAGPEIGVKKFYGKISGHLSAVGEVTPDSVARALAGIAGRKFEGASADYRKKATELLGDFTPPREFGFCPGCPHRASYWTIKNVLAEDDRAGFVSGDIGCYTMGVWPTGFNQVKSVHAMGSGVGMSSGFGKLGEFGFDQPVISVVGDSTFYHAAIPALINAVYNKSGFLLVVLDNAATAMTGFQPHPGTGKSATGEPQGLIEIERVCASLGLDATIVDPYDLAATKTALTEALGKTDRVQALIFRRTCALVQGREGGFPYRMSIDQDVCRGGDCGCNRYCNRVFRCPGITWDDKAGRAAIDEVICVGCGVCEQVCPSGAIKKEKKR
jgi:indolepyruvate ferredoxin oxidoreductase alpha subunit